MPNPCHTVIENQCHVQRRAEVGKERVTDLFRRPLPSRLPATRQGSVNYYDVGLPTSVPYMLPQTPVEGLIESVGRELSPASGTAAFIPLRLGPIRLRRRGYLHWWWQVDAGSPDEEIALKNHCF